MVSITIIDREYFMMECTKGIGRSVGDFYGTAMMADLARVSKTFTTPKNSCLPFMLLRWEARPRSPCPETCGESCPAVWYSGLAEQWIPGYPGQTIDWISVLDWSSSDSPLSSSLSDIRCPIYRRYRTGPRMWFFCLPLVAFVALWLAFAALRITTAKYYHLYAILIYVCLLHLCL